MSTTAADRYPTDVDNNCFSRSGRFRYDRSLLIGFRPRFHIEPTMRFSHVLAAIAASVLLSLLCGCAITSPVDRPVSKSNDRETIRATLAALNAACADRDLDAFMALFDDNDDILFVGSDKGEVFRGREATRGFMQRLYGMPFVFSFDLENVVLNHDGDHARVFVDGTMVRTGDRGKAIGKVGRSPYRFSIAMVLRGGGWRWQMFHGSVPGAE